MENIYEFSAYNTESVYGFGTEVEAKNYLEWLNKNKTINLFELAESKLTIEQADTLAINLTEHLQDLNE